ncbi:MAG TPA: hypothetical protein VKV39_03865 [Candidatus Sulfotelmatobacter sp.]|nr:hypothetical protein [Candidatus Sulfotelmatobacter sp.]
MRNGVVILCVYLVSEGSYIKRWGVYPEQDRSKSYIYVSDVDTLAESPYRLPVQFTNKLYKSGESHMGGYTIFTVLFSDGTRQAYGRKNALDFIRYPEGKSQGDVIGVSPHEGREAELMGGPEPYWCLFSE